MPAVRVLLGSRPAASVEIEVGGPYLVTSSGDWRVLAQGSSLPAAQVTAAAGGLRIGSRTFASDRLDLKLVQPDTLWVAGVRYPGHLRLVRRADGRVAVVNLVGLEQYVLGVLGPLAAEDEAGEGEPGPEDAICAQAIALRSRVLYEMKTAASGSDWDTEDDAAGLVYRGLEAGQPGQPARQQQETRLREIVGQTRGIVLAYKGRLFCTGWTAACGGRTLAGRAVFPAAAPPLIGVECPTCRKTDRSAWEKKIPGQELRARAAKYSQKTGQSLGPLVRIEVSAAPAGRVPEVTLVGARGTCKLSAHLFRTQVVGEELLPGSVFTVEQREDDYHFSGRGVGHGVGLCQAGARGLARAGRTCPEVLARYFPGAELISVW